MKVFIFEWLDNVSNCYHCGGGCVIIAEDRKAARELIDQTDNLSVTDDEWQSVVEYELAGDYDERVFIFPDAGCCG